MPASESKRYALREKLTEAFGPEAAGTFMEHLPPVRWDKLATKDDLRQMADKMASKDDLRQMADLLQKETRAELKEMRGEMQARSAEQQSQLIATMIGQHRMTMLALVGVFVAVMASVLIPLLTSSPA